MSKKPEHKAGAKRGAGSKAANDYKLEVLGFFQADAADIIGARTRSQFIHRGGNIRSAGDEVETSVREFLRRRLPASYTVHHGHFLDKTLTLSRQCDVMIADHGHFPVLFRGQDGLEYLPYEGVYAFGEVKSSLQDKHLDEIISHMRHVSTQLKREDVPDGYIDSFRQDGDELVWEPWAERGHLFRFLFAVSSEGFDVERALKLLCDTDPRYAPNLICLLDRGVIMSARATLPSGEVTATYVHPQKLRPPIQSNEADGWTFSVPNSSHFEGATLFYAYMQILEHMKNNVLLRTTYMEYVENLVTLNTTFIHRN